VQFGIYLRDITHGDFGTSLRTKQAVTDMVIERLPQTIELTIASMIFASFFGIILGMIAAYWSNTKVDVAMMVGANIGVSMPVFWLGLMLAYLFALVLKDTPFWLPPSGRITSGIIVENLTVLWGLNPGDRFYDSASFLSNLVILNALITGNSKALLDALKHLILPAVALGTIPMSIIARMTRSSLLEVLSADYIRTARAKGQHERVVLMTHAMKNAFLPIITVIGLQFGGLLAGAILTETIFSWPGMGRLVVERILARDYPTVQGAVLVIALLFVVLNLLVDLSYAYLDPRIRYE